jgi:cytochrome c556
MIKSLVLPIGLCLGIGVTAVIAHEGATGTVKERMEAMKSMAGEMKALADMFKAPDTFDRDRAVAASQAVASHAESIPDLFPEGSDHSPSKASDAIWEDWDGFAADAVSLKDAALAFEVGVKDGAELAELKPEFAAMASDCQSCHENFRVPE